MSSEWSFFEKKLAGMAIIKVSNNGMVAGYK